MSNHKNPYVTDQLQPRRADGKSRGVYPLHGASVHPTREIGRDEYGMPIYETMPTVDYRDFVTMSGCINKVPVRTCSVSDGGTDGQNYELAITEDKIKSGWIPLDLCPYSTTYTHLTRGPFVKPTAGEEDCGGAPNGCTHIKALMKKRQARALEMHNKEVAAFESRSRAEQEATRLSLQEGIVAGVGAVMARHLSGQESREAGRNRLRNAATKSEE